MMRNTLPHGAYFNATTGELTPSPSEQLSNDYAALKAENERLQAMIDSALAIPATVNCSEPGGMADGANDMRARFREALGVRE